MTCKIKILENWILGQKKGRVDVQTIIANSVYVDLILCKSGLQFWQRQQWHSFFEPLTRIAKTRRATKKTIRH